MGEEFPALEHVPDAVLVADEDKRIRYVNPAAGALLGWTRDELVGAPLVTVIPPQLRDLHVAGFEAYLCTGRMRHAGRPLRVQALRRDGTLVDVDLVVGPLPGEGAARLAVGVLRDAGERIALQQELMVGRYLRASLDVTAALQRATTSEAAFRRLLPTLCRNLDWDVAALWLWQAEPGRLYPVQRWHEEASGQAAQDMTRDRRLRPGEGLPGLAWSSGGPVWVPEVPEETALPRAEVAGKHALRTGVAFPLLGRRGPLGVVEFFSHVQREPNDELLGLLDSIGRQIGQFLERLHTEAALREALDALQTSLLPAALPAIPGVELASHYRSGGGGSVGGDFYDVFPGGDGRWMLVIGDVCGKGAPAAAVTALARYTIRTAAIEHPDPRRVLDLLNRAIAEGGAQRPFLTACLVQLVPAPQGAQVTITSAGHPLPLLRRRDGSVLPAGAPGDLLGVLDDPEFDPCDFRLDERDSLLLYTDGVTEARDPRGLLLGESGLAGVYRSLGPDPREVIAGLRAALDRHTDGRAARDDVAAVVATVRGAAG